MNLGNKKGTSVLKYCSLYSNISFVKKGALFIAKKDTFGSGQKFRGGTCPLSPPGSYAPESARKKVTCTPKARANRA